LLNRSACVEYNEAHSLDHPTQGKYTMELTYNGRPRVVITGIGALTPLGDVAQLWDGLQNGRSGIGRISLFDPSHITVQIASEVKKDLTQYIDAKTLKRMARVSQLAAIATRMSLQDAGLSVDQLQAESDTTGVVIGTTQGGYDVAAVSNIRYAKEGRRPRPLDLINALPNMVGYYVGLEAQATGPLTTISAACASGTHAIGEAMRLIRDGRAPMVITGGAESVMQDYVFEALYSMTVLAHDYNANPTEASRPFDADRSGFVFGEAAAFMVLESLEHALQRSAHIYGEVLGYGVSADAQHVSAPDADGRGAAKAMRWALNDAGLNPQDIDYINAHGTSTPLNDATETTAIKKVFGDYAYQVPISSTKSMIGHTLGASGAVEAVVSILSMRDGVIHPTINYHTPDPACDLDYVPNEAREKPINTVLSNSFGFGGQNACIILRKM
jgi:beta-ketoacyl-acyl-carrier-protein synthase II